MMAEQVPQCLLWLPILHRMTRVENGQYRYVYVGRAGTAVFVVVTNPSSDDQGRKRSV